MAHTGFTLEIEGFKGPLALLLDLIEQHKLGINDISLARVADEYVEYVQDRARIPLSETAQFLVVASTLLLIKSRSLLPTIELSQDEEDDIKELEHRLREYGTVRRAACSLRRIWKKRQFLPESVPPREIVFAPGANCTLATIHQTAHRLSASIPTFSKAPTARIARELRLEDVVDDLIARMQQAARDSFRNVVAGRDKVEAIVSFLALLELIKQGSLDAEQRKNFDDIVMSHEQIAVPHYGS